MTPEASRYSDLGKGTRYCDERVCLSVSQFVCVCVCVCVSVCEHISGITVLSLPMLPMAVARSFTGGAAIRYVLSCLWMASYVCT